MIGDEPKPSRYTNNLEFAAHQLFLPTDKSTWKSGIVTNFVPSLHQCMMGY